MEKELFDKKLETSVNATELLRLLEKGFDKLEYTKQSFQIKCIVTKAIEPYLPLFEIILDIYKELIESYEQVQYNKKICAILIDRAEAANAAIKALKRRKEEYVYNFISQNFYNSFVQFLILMKKIKKFFYDTSRLKDFCVFTTYHNIKDKFKELVSEYNKLFDDLKLGIATISEERLNYELRIIDYEILEMIKVLMLIDDIKLFLCFISP
jgi:hypothetical protein